MEKNLNGKELGKGISQRKDGRYCGRYTDRFGKRKSIYHEKLAVVREELNKALYRDKVLSNNVYEGITLDDWHEKWLNLFKKNTVRPSTLTEYEKIYWKHISPELGSMKLSEISQLHVRELLNQKQQYKSSMQRSIRNLMIDIFNKAVESEFMKRNPAKGIKIYQSSYEEKTVKALTIDEQFAFFKAAKTSWYYNAFVVQINSGLRSGELFALTEDDLDFERGLIKVRRTLVFIKKENNLKVPNSNFYLDAPKTKASIRAVPMTEICRQALKNQIKQKHELENKISADSEWKDLLFTTHVNTPIGVRGYNSAMKKIVRQVNKSGICNLPYITGHWFRHTFATRCFEAGIQAKTVQKYLGHSNIQMTMNVYTHIFDNYEEQEIKKFENVMLNTMNELERNPINSTLKNNVIDINGVKLV